MPVGADRVWMMVITATNVQQLCKKLENTPNTCVSVHVPKRGVVVLHYVVAHTFPTLFQSIHTCFSRLYFSNLLDSLKLQRDDCFQSIHVLSTPVASLDRLAHLEFIVNAGVCARTCTHGAA